MKEPWSRSWTSRWLRAPGVTSLLRDEWRGRGSRDESVSDPIRLLNRSQLCHSGVRRIHSLEAGRAGGFSAPEWHLFFAREIQGGTACPQAVGSGASRGTACEPPAGGLRSSRATSEVGSQLRKGDVFVERCVGRIPRWNGLSPSRWVGRVTRQGVRASCRRLEVKPRHLGSWVTASEG
jgi:hypothetical protein